MRPAPRLILLLVLCGGRGFTSAETRFVTAEEGKDFREKFVFNTFGTQMLFCKNDCKKQENILVITEGTGAQNGRYSTEFEKHSNSYVLHVGINNLMSSDSGSYRCESWNEAVVEETVEFHLNVSRAAPSSEPRASERPSVTFSLEYDEYDVTPVTSTLTPPENLTSGPGRLLWLLLIPVAVVMTSVPLILICRKKKTQNGSPVLTSKRQISLEDQEPRLSRRETQVYENLKAMRESADCIYQNLRVDTMDPNHIYSNV
ncbi:hypothetical protein NL108_013216 [Boleophthalmus pectinirostris]|uniref:uncharacterized protein LOC129409748 isoform X2 n=1 Tax=Boleophthalmus pectinirostris TaxID=150288 RepID=UPI00242E28CE|nr:uncharacterized protein LOC129409748 isoform X2 [Boleophthalmus pectinirostris]KAJ0055824.1 hypothetical protein NL108_013216 [Boleophthalmus pectinirostris]